ncbi:UNKNOWN [Stylonychia lemnae]|uniref:Uncharacterized protein n=1 Tax=Stylonychia lemnae TaxID=5949 RepID=A0A078AAM9_STYLE|nr:UNKNOWN [Stylonychia lemnae]|eukprot:CDW78891.1 UNKNOWN [Stylonychia lemnae]
MNTELESQFLMPFANSPDRFKQSVSFKELSSSNNLQRQTSKLSNINSAVGLNITTESPNQTSNPLNEKVSKSQQNSFFLQIKKRLIEFDLIEKMLQEENSSRLEEIIKDQQIMKSSFYPKLIILSKKKVSNQQVISLIDREKKDLMRQLRENFKFIGGFKNKNVPKESQGSERKAVDWRVDHSINKKILKPTTTITQCQKSVEDLNRNNDYFSNYLTSEEESSKGKSTFYRLFDRNKIVEKIKVDYLKLGQDSLQKSREKKLSQFQTNDCNTTKNLNSSPDNKTSLASGINNTKNVNQGFTDYSLNYIKKIAQQKQEQGGEDDNYEVKLSDSTPKEKNLSRDASLEKHTARQDYSKFSLDQPQSSQVSRNLVSRSLLIQDLSTMEQKQLKNELRKSRYISRELDQQNNNIQRAIKERLNYRSFKKLYKQNLTNGDQPQSYYESFLKSNSNEVNSSINFKSKRKSMQIGQNPLGIKQKLIQIDLTRLPVISAHIKKRKNHEYQLSQHHFKTSHNKQKDDLVTKNLNYFRVSQFKKHHLQQRLNQRNGLFNRVENNNFYSDSQQNRNFKSIRRLANMNQSFDVMEKYRQDNSLEELEEKSASLGLSQRSFGSNEVPFQMQQKLQPRAYNSFILEQEDRPINIEINDIESFSNLQGSTIKESKYIELQKSAQSKNYDSKEKVKHNKFTRNNSETRFK